MSVAFDHACPSGVSTNLLTDVDVYRKRSRREDIRRRLSGLARSPEEEGGWDREAQVLRGLR